MNDSSGPDKIIEAPSYIATKLTDAVRIRSLEGSKASMQPISIYTVFNQVAKRIPNNIALVSCKLDKSVTYSFEQYWNACNNAAKSFIKLGLEPSTSVAILGFNAPQWMISLFGAIFAGGIACGIYTTNSTEACEYILQDSSSQIVVVENQTQLDKILKCRNTCNIKAIIQYKGEIKDNHEGLIYSWDEFMRLGTSVENEKLNERIKAIAPNKCASLIYTSGTTGSPKAVMLSHDNINFTAKFNSETIGSKFGNERIVSYLPLSHIAAQMVDCFVAVMQGITVFFAQPDALKGTLSMTLKEAKPTLFFGVPRVWEKIHEKIELTLKELSSFKLRIFKWATGIGYEYTISSFANRKKNFVKYFLARKLVLDKIRAQLGFEKCRLFYSGAAQINPKTLDFFFGLGFPLCEAFGMSESSGPHILGFPKVNKVGSVGSANNKFNAVKIGNNDELCLFGRNVFMGYLNKEDKTLETIDDDGWLHTGDVAKIDSDKFVFITGRIKELIITAGGENIAPVAIEDAVKNELSHIISNCMLVGDKRKFLSILITLKCKVNLDTLEAMDDLTDEFIDWLKSKGSNSVTVSDVIAKKEKIVYDEIEAAIKRANNKAISRAACVQKFSVLPKDFSIATEELGPTLKLKRPFVMNKYATIVDDMYKDDSAE